MNPDNTQANEVAMPSEARSPLPPQQPIYQQPGYAPYFRPRDDPEKTLSYLVNQERNEAFMWFLAAVIPTLVEVFLIISLVLGIIRGTTENMFTNIVWMIIVGLFDFIYLYIGFRGRRYSKQLLMDPTDIVSDYMSLFDPIIKLVVGILIGGIFGLVGGIMALTTRSFVMKHQQEFWVLEQNYLQELQASQTEESE